tara:strand:- start:1190 stop:2026 length:837 start_codon:yes stop_codon:yes gene_type:complete
MKPGLYIVATPIGNLDDITIRAQKTLNEADIIICENPKHSIKLLSKLGIKKKLFSLHDYNEEIVIKKIKNFISEKSIALISDAGSPLISDPGYKLVKYFIDNSLKVTSIPGPSSVIMSMQISGMPNDKFKFLGFPPKQKKGFSEFFKNLKNELQTVVFFISNHKLLESLEMLEKFIESRKISVCKELTKINEGVIRGSATDIIKELKKNKKKSLGEFVVVIEAPLKKIKGGSEISLSVEKQINKLLKKYSLTDVVEIVHKLSNISRKMIYKKALELKK